MVTGAVRKSWNYWGGALVALACASCTAPSAPTQGLDPLCQGQVVDGRGTDAAFNLLGVIGVDAQSTVWLLDGELMRQVSADGTVSHFVFKSPVARVSSMRFAKDGTGYATDWAQHQVVTFNQAGEARVLAGTSYGPETPESSRYADGPAAQARFAYPGGLCVDASGNVFVADTRNHCIRKITPNGDVTTVAGVAGSKWKGSPRPTDGPAAKALFSYPSKVAVAADGTLYVIDGLPGMSLRTITTDGQVRTLVESDPGNSLEDFSDLDTSPSRGVVVAQGTSIYRIDGDALVGVVVQERSQPRLYGLSVGPDDRLYAIETNRVRRVDDATRSLVDVAGHLANCPPI